MLTFSVPLREATEKLKVTENDKNKAYNRLQSFQEKRQKLVATGTNSLKKENKTEIII